MTNLLTETLVTLEDGGFTESDVDFVTDGSASCSWDEFAKQAAGYNYDSGYGSQEVNESLAVVMKDGTWFSRGEYDGSEWWQYNTVPNRTTAEGSLELRTWWRKGGY